MVDDTESGTLDDRATEDGVGVGIGEGVGVGVGVGVMVTVVHEVAPVPEIFTLSKFNSAFTYTWAESVQEP